MVSSFTIKENFYLFHHCGNLLDILLVALTFQEALISKIIAYATHKKLKNVSVKNLHYREWLANNYIGLPIVNFVHIPSIKTENALMKGAQ